MGAFLRLGEREVRQWTAEPPIAPFPGTNVAGMTTLTNNPDMALTIHAVWGCVGLLANTISSLPLEEYTKTGSSVPMRVPDGPLLTSPAAKMTQATWIHQVIVSLLMRGNAYGQIVGRDTQQRATQIELMNPDSLRVTQDPDTGLVSYKVIKTDQILAPHNVWHLPGMCLPGSRIGLSPISYAAATLGIDLGARKFATDFFAGGGVPKGILTSDQRVNQEEARSIKERWNAATGRNRDTTVLGQGLTYQPLSVKPEESQFLATQMADINQIANFFWVPAEMVGGTAGGGMTYANVEQRSLHFLTYSVAPWLKRVEDSISDLLARPRTAKFDVRQLLRTDAETAAKIHIQYLAGKVFAPSEIREEIGAPPMTEAQKAEADLVPLTVTPLGGAKALPGLKLPPGPVAPVPANDTTQPQGA